MHDKTEEKWPTVTQKPARVYQLSYKNDRQMHIPKAMQKLTAEMLDLKRFKDVAVPYGIYAPFVKQMFNSWTNQTGLFHKTRKI